MDLEDTKKKLDKADFSKHKETMEKFERYIELKKLDRDDFNGYKSDHRDYHDEADRKHTVIVQMLQQIIKLQSGNNK